ncbi:hypothetical protein J7L36_02385 [bacterium]|nr:hypothetical protein [bacterium]
MGRWAIKGRKIKKRIMRTIGKKFKNLVQKQTIKLLEKRDRERAGESMRYYGIDNEIVNSLPDEIWETWEGADGEIRRIIDDTIRERGIDKII